MSIRQIYNDEREFLDSEKEDNKYYIGVCKYYPQENYIIMLCTVSPMTFIKYSTPKVRTYLKNYSITTFHNQPKINIMKLSIHMDGTYRVVIKTHWLRLVQRHWKRAYRENMQRVYSPIERYKGMLYGGRIAAMKPRLAGLMNAYR